MGNDKEKNGNGTHIPTIRRLIRKLVPELRWGRHVLPSTTLAVIIWCTWWAWPYMEQALGQAKQVTKNQLAIAGVTTNMASLKQAVEINTNAVEQSAKDVTKQCMDTIQETKIEVLKTVDGLDRKTDAIDRRVDAEVAQRRQDTAVQRARDKDFENQIDALGSKIDLLIRLTEKDCGSP